MADLAVASLSADPITLAELEVAAERFAKPVAGSPFFSNLKSGVCDEPYDAGLVAIDLVGRVVVVDSTYSSPGSTGFVKYHNGQGGTNTQLRYHLAGDWFFTRDRCGWPTVAESRRRQRSEKPRLDVREVFYGRPMLAFVARQTFVVFARRDAIAARVRSQWGKDARARLARQEDVPVDEVDPDRLTDEEITPKTWPGQEQYASPYYDTLKDIHAAWLLTRRADLGDECPRAVALERHEHLTWDLEDRCDQWSRLGECPRGLDESSYAFRYGGFGTHELVMYYDLVRDLLWSCWERLTEGGPQPLATNCSAALAADAFVAAEVPRLESVRDQWLNTPDPECHQRTPGSVIDRERSRLPEGMSGHDAMVDPDCPCCQMMSDMPGPVFWHLDGSGMDDGFAFDLYNRTREQWEQEQHEWEEAGDRVDAEMRERERLGLPDRTLGEDDCEPVWSADCCVGGDVHVPLGIRLFGLGCFLAELIVRLRGETDGESSSPEFQQLIDQLNRDFGNLREILQNSGPALAEALFEPVIDCFGETLGEVSISRPDLSPMCESLVNRLATFLDEPPSNPIGDPSDPPAA